MTEELTRAAADAGEALGMSVTVSHSGRFSAPTILVELWPPLDSEDGGQPAEQRDVLPSAALAYLNGLETGARIQRERYVELVGLVRTLVGTMQNGNGAEVVPYGISPIIANLGGLLPALTKTKG